MPSAIAELLPFTFGLIASPLPAVAVIVLLMARDGLVRAGVFILSWVVVAFVIAWAVSLITGDSVRSGGVPPDWTGWLRVLIGTAMLVFAGLAVHRHITREPDAPRRPPRWLSAAETMDTLDVIGLAVALSVLNPTTVPLLLGAGAAIGDLGLGTAANAGAALVFAVVGAAGLLLALGAAVGSGEHGRRGLERARAWLLDHDDVVSVTMLFVFGGLILARGLGVLAD
ncbi:GAP family protein [Allonocardiopsis opalescens]|uniref:Sap-like sulfolipid-1-addressing protein n=1 Tax=Allonocardiopsis opalescens TaxID=1144618 RepID=A0A2T0QEG4_9ACTN|nr:GAP family protein [Allonocardiopsis opalescens]PRY02336.1 Sap-like sulfolipid-1-addressing protein [Allonocardiopsis opalescens]